MSRLSTLTVTLSVILALTFCDPVTPTDVKEASRELIHNIHRMVLKARDGNYLRAMSKDVLDLQNSASGLLEELPEVPQCEVQYVTKMAAAGTGSHEVLTVLLAKDELQVLNGRLALALAFLEEVSRLMDDELSLTTDVGPHLTSIVFGANVTIDIIEAADEAVTAAAKPDTKEHGDERARRFLNYDLGGGWKVGVSGVSWSSRNGRYNFNARPTFKGGNLGVGASFSISF